MLVGQFQAALLHAVKYLDTLIPEPWKSNRLHAHQRPASVPDYTQTPSSPLGA